MDMDNSTVYTSFIGLLGRKNIKSEVKAKFKALPDTSSKVKYILRLLKEYDLIFEIEPRHAKNDAVAQSHRDAANSLYREGKFVDALIGYNKALCYAGGDEGLSFGYANRSATYLELKLYDACLENIRLAREAGYPAKLMSKLEDREKKCHEAIGKVRQQVKKFEPKLSYPASAENPSVADCIELVVNEKYGRHFVAKQDLKVGDIVIVDRPYQVYLFHEFNYRNCTYCGAENQHNLIPCPGCTKTMFCSGSCLESADKFHKYFCPLIEEVVEQNTSNLLFSLRILLSQMHDFGSVKALAAAREARSENNGLPKYSDDDRIFQQYSMDAFFDLAPGVEVLNIEKAVSLGLVYTWLIKHTDIVAQLRDLESHDLFLDLYYRYNKILDINAYGMDVVDRSESGMLIPATLALNVSPTISLLNHSCVSNTSTISCSNSVMLAMVVRPLKKGDQLLICYGINHIEDPKKIRQKSLLEKYQFHCECEACTKNYPTLMEMPQPKVPSKVALNASNFFQLDDQKRALRKFKDCQEYLEKNDAHYPLMGLHMVRMSLLGAFNVLSHNYTLKVSLK